MGNHKEELEAIMDLFEEWCRESGADYATMGVCPGEYTYAWDRVGEESRFDILKDYENAETPGAATPRESR